MPKQKVSAIPEPPRKDPAAVSLGRRGGLKTAKRGSAYFRKLAGMRKARKGGRPKKHET